MAEDEAAAKARQARLQELRASRKYIKCSITRLNTFAENQADVDESSLLTLRSKRERLTELFKKYEDCQMQVLGLDENDNDDVSEVEGKYFFVLTVLNEAIQLKSSPQTAENSTYRTKLPTIQIKNFSGKYSEYTPFMNLFDAIIHKDRSIDNVQKLYYLRSFLEKEPFELIKNLTLSSENYDEARRLLNDRYNHKFKIVNEHINSLLDMNALVRSTPSNIRDFVSHVKQCMAALKNLDVNTDNWDPIILSILYRKLDTYTSRAYQLERSDESDPTVVDFLQYLEKRALALENAEPVSSNKSQKTSVVNVAVTPPASGVKPCEYCSSKEHKLFACKSFKCLPFTGRIKLVDEKGICHTCLMKHKGKCRFHFRCSICKLAHNTLLHNDLAAEKENITLISHDAAQRKLLPTVKVKLYSQDGREVHIKAALDCCSEAHIVTKKVIDALGITPKLDSTTIVGVNNRRVSSSCSVPLEVFSEVTPFKVTLNCNVMESITLARPQLDIDRAALRIPEGIKLADDDFDKPSEINMLIGSDVFFQVLFPEQQGVLLQAAPTPNKQEAQGQFQGLRIFNTSFGHIVGGSLPIINKKDTSSKVSLLCINCDNDVNETIKKFWKAESIPEKFIANKSEQDLCEEIFRTTTTLENNKFQVDLPIKLPLEEINDALGNSFDFALYRFLNLEKKLHKM
ncbi:hypothetical protein NE865_12208 [Phthorimaea operculella]|nr:hypothetical protein NE865_12208 [Phthorimaea operculella]